MRIAANAGKDRGARNKGKLMDIEVRINWTPNQWRRFFGHADMTPLIELASVTIDRMAMAMVDRRLEVLAAEPGRIGAQTGRAKGAGLAASGGRA
jgi:hypothetical protein